MRLNEVKVPANSWEQLVLNYAIFCGLPAWRASGEEVVSDDPERVEERLSSLLEKLRGAGEWPSRPSELQPSHIARLFPKRDLAANNKNPTRRTRTGSLWCAIVLEASGYDCHYCGRNAFDVFREEKRTLRYELDHLTPRAKKGATLSLQNMVAACRSCNLLRGQLDIDKVTRELDSLARAI